ncbi:MAG: response regulator transcription factor [Rhodospirillaceae bacterium]|nr:response regulator transcription factor [Rhodospirillaceae bacterium]
MNPATPHILVVEDDRFVRELVEIYLSAEGYRVTAVADGIEMRAAMARAPADLVIMDLKLPGEDGLTLTKYLREAHQIGIVILTTRNDAVDRVVGLDCGADDYITKPFDQRELLARIRSVLRRSANLQPAATPAPKMMGQPCENGISFHGYRLDPINKELVAPTGERVDLTSNEYSLLEYLARNPGRIMSRDLLMDLVLKRSRDPLDRSIDVLITRVRHKIESDPRRPALIKTVRGSGYVIPQDAAVSIN